MNNHFVFVHYGVQFLTQRLNKLEWRLKMDEMIGKWIRETIHEFDKAKLSQNLFKMHQMKVLRYGLEEMKHKLLKI